MIKVFNLKQKKYKLKLILSFVFLLLAVLSTINLKPIASAENNDFSSFSTSILDVINGIDLSEMESLIDGLEDFNIFDTNNSFCFIAKFHTT